MDNNLYEIKNNKLTKLPKINKNKSLNDDEITKLCKKYMSQPILNTNNINTNDIINERNKYIDNKINYSVYFRIFFYIEY